MTSNEKTLDEQLDAAWRASGPAADRLRKALADLDEEVTRQRALSDGGWPTRTDTILFYAQAAHAARAELTRITTQITALQDAIRNTYM